MLPTVTPGNKRIVVHIVKGRLAGMRKIVGHLVIDGTRTLPPHMFTTDHGRIEFVRDAPRYVLFTEKE